MNKLSIPAAVAEVRAWLNNESGPCPYVAVELLTSYAADLTNSMSDDTRARLAKLEAFAHPPLDLQQMLKGWVPVEKHHARVTELISANNVLVEKNRELKRQAS
jgi:hypothetical protein